MSAFKQNAIIEIIKGNKNYSPCTDSNFIINKFTLSELTYWLIKDYGYGVASQYVEEYSAHLKSIDIKTIKKAMVFRYAHKKQKLSMADCIGCTMAKRLGINFLTGNKEFETFENVEFVK